MKLKSGCILWPQIYRGPVPRTAPLENDIRCDVAIIGSGITGALAAWHLTREGIHTVMVDRQPVARGSTAASTGLLQYEIDTPLVELTQKIGKDRAIAAYLASLEALRAFGPLVDDLEDRCGLTARPSLFLASQEKDVDLLRAEHDARRSIQIDVEFLSGTALRGAMNLSRPAALWSREAFEVDPYTLTMQLVLRSIQRGLEVYTPTEISACQPGDAGMTLHSVQGPRIEAKKVVFATGYETMGLLPAGLCWPASTYALASQHLSDFPGWPQRCLIWESAHPYLYMRTTQDGRAIVGGEDVDIVDPEQRDRLLPQKTLTLCNRFTKLLPEINIDPDCAWAGIFAQTRDGLPYIGRLRHLPHAYFALGYGGNGITFSLLAARIITQLFLGRAAAESQLFGFERGR